MKSKLILVGEGFLILGPSLLFLGTILWLPSHVGPALLLLIAFAVVGATRGSTWAYDLITARHRAPTPAETCSLIGCEAEATNVGNVYLCDVHEVGPDPSAEYRVAGVRRHV